MRGHLFAMLALAAGVAPAAESVPAPLAVDPAADAPIVGSRVRADVPVGQSSGRNAPRGHSPGTCAHRRWKRRRAAGRAR